MHLLTADTAETQILLLQVEQGDPAALGQLLARHQDYLRRVVELRLEVRLRGRVDPSDVVQEGLLEACNRIGDYLSRRPMSFRLWLRQTAQQKLIDLRRRHLTAAQRSVRHELPLPSSSSLQLARALLAPAGGSPSQHLAERELVAAVRQALADMSEEDREILLLRNFEELSSQESAVVLGIAPAAASKRYGRALLRLRKVLQEHGQTGSAP
jgi:RNA polymerase sigma-70 factor (ECF subfamily)